VVGVDAVPPRDDIGDLIRTGRHPQPVIDKVSQGDGRHVVRT
jgi:hypothetical protein